MKLTALAVVILALGIVVGLALAGGSSGRPASAIPQCPGPSSQCPTPTPAPPQQREDQMMVFGTTRAFTASTVWQGPAGFFPIIALDPADYPADTAFSYEAILVIGSDNTTGCTRLYNLTTDLPVVGSDVCLTSTTVPTSAPGFLIDRMRSGPFALALGENEYEVQGMCPQPACGVSWNGTRIIVEWTE